MFLPHKMTPRPDPGHHAAKPSTRPFSGTHRLRDEPLPRPAGSTVLEFREPPP